MHPCRAWSQAPTYEYKPYILESTPYRFGSGQSKKSRDQQDAQNGNSSINSGNVEHTIICIPNNGQRTTILCKRLNNGLNSAKKCRAHIENGLVPHLIC